MARVFISGRIRSMPNYNEPAFREAEKKLTSAGHDVMNPIWLHGARPEAFSHSSYLHVCFSMIDICEAIYFLSDWRKSLGSVKEYEYAKLQHKKMMFENPNDIEYGV